MPAALIEYLTRLYYGHSTLTHSVYNNYMVSLAECFHAAPATLF